MSKKRIMIIAASKLPIPAYKGGATETLITNLLNDKLIVDNDNYSIDVYSHCEGEKIDGKNVNYYFKKENKIEKIVFYFFWFIRQCSRKKLPIPDFFPLRIAMSTELNNYDIIILEGNKDQVCCLRRIYKGKIGLHIHTVMTLTNEIFGAKSVIKKCDFLIANSDYTKKVLSSINPYEANKIITIKNCIKISDISSCNTKMRDKFREVNKINDEFVFVYCGRLEPGKGVLELIKALKISKSKSKLLIIGSSWFSSNKKTKYVDDLMREAKELGNQIQFTGYVDHKNIGEYYKIADVAIMPSIYQEAAGLVALEAQAAGLPIIISNVGGISEFVHPPSSLKINIDDNFINSLANMINEISLNKDLYNYEKKLSQQYINRFNIDEYSKKFIDVFNRFS